MKTPEILDQVTADLAAAQVYRDPIHVDGATVIPVAKIRAGGTATPVGVFFISGGQISWKAAVDEGGSDSASRHHHRKASAVIATLAMLRRPPWPDIHLTRQLPS